MFTQLRYFSCLFLCLGACADVPDTDGDGGPGWDGGPSLDAAQTHDVSTQPDGALDSSDPAVDSGPNLDSGSAVDSGTADSGSADSGSADSAVGEDGGVACGTIRTPSIGRTVLEMGNPEPPRGALPHILGMGTMPDGDIMFAVRSTPLQVGTRFIEDPTFVVRASPSGAVRWIRSDWLGETGRISTLRTSNTGEIALAVTHAGSASIHRLDGDGESLSEVSIAGAVVTAVRFGSGGLLYATGYIRSATQVDFGTGPLDSMDSFALAVDGDGETRFLWTFDDEQPDRSLGLHLRDMAVSNDGHVAVVGELRGATDFGGGRVGDESGATSIALLVLNPDATLRFVRLSGSASLSSRQANAVVFDACNRVYFGGTADKGMDFGAGESYARMDLFVVSYDLDGALRWERRIEAERAMGEERNPIAIVTSMVAVEGGIALSGFVQRGDLTVSRSPRVGAAPAGEPTAHLPVGGFAMLLDGEGELRWSRSTLAQAEDICTGPETLFVGSEAFIESFE